MKVYNENKTIELNEYDLSKGYLKDDKIFVRHHEEQPEIKEVSHIEIVKEYPNGGKDAIEVIDVPYQPARPAYDEYEDIQVYVPYTKEELAKIEISNLKQKLRDTDYKAIKFAEGELSEAEYAPIRTERRKWRAEINKLES